MGWRGRHTRGSVLAALAAIAAAAIAVLAATLANRRRQRPTLANRRRQRPMVATDHTPPPSPAVPNGHTPPLTVATRNYPAPSATSTMRPRQPAPRHLAPRTPAPLAVPLPADPSATPDPAGAAAPAPEAPAADPAGTPAPAPEPRAADPAGVPAPAPEPPAAGEPADGEPVVPVGGPPRHLAEGSSRGRALVGVLVAVGIVVVLGVGAVLVAGAGDSGTEATAGTSEPPRDEPVESTTTTTTAAVAAEDAFTAAAGRLEAAGTFAYTGTVSASDVSAVRPSLWLAVDTTVEGEASLADASVHEVAVAPNGRATETVVAGTSVWGRSARDRDGLADVDYEGIPELSRPEPATKGTASLAGWLAAAVDPRAAGVDGEGRRVYQATIPAEALGPTERNRRAVDAQVTLTLDRAGDPVRIEIATGPEGPPLHLVLDLARLGRPVAIEPPA